MPELPEVEYYRRYFARHALGKRMVRVRVPDDRILGETRKHVLMRRLRGRTFIETRRHGKHLFVAIDDGSWLRLHFGMTGDLDYYDQRPALSYQKVVFDFEDGGHLAYCDPRLFGVVELIPTPEEFIADRRLGPDPLDPTYRFRDFDEGLGVRRAAIKSLLMSQELIAGLGNLYVDEALYQTGIHPRRTADRLTTGERRALFTAIRRILGEVIARQERDEELPATYLVLHRTEDARCPRCGGSIRRSEVFGRTTYFCGQHQR